MTPKREYEKERISDAFCPIATKYVRNVKAIVWTVVQKVWLSACNIIAAFVACETAFSPIQKKKPFYYLCNSCPVQFDICFSNVLGAVIIDDQGLDDFTDSTMKYLHSQWVA